MRRTTTLWDILFGTGARAGPSRLPETPANERIHELGRAVVARAVGRPQPGADSLVAEQLKGLLSLCVAEDIFRKSWNDSGLFRRSLYRSAIQPDGPSS